MPQITIGNLLLSVELKEGYSLISTINLQHYLWIKLFRYHVYPAISISKRAIENLSLFVSLTLAQVPGQQVMTHKYSYM